MDADYRKMWADYWASREDYIHKYKDEFPESEFIRHALNYDFYPSFLEKPCVSKRQRTESEAKMAEEPVEKKSKVNTPNDENCALLRPKSPLEPENEEKTSEIKDENDAVYPKIKETDAIYLEINEENDAHNAELKNQSMNYDLLIKENPRNQNTALSSDTYQPGNPRKLPNFIPNSPPVDQSIKQNVFKDYGNRLALVAQFTANYSTIKFANNLTLRQKVNHALRSCHFFFNWSHYRIEGIKGKAKSTCELYFKHFLAAIGRGIDKKAAIQATSEQLMTTMENYKKFGSWDFKRPVKVIDVKVAQTMDLERLLPKLTLVAGIIKRTENDAYNSKLMVNEAFRKFRGILWRCSFRRRKHVVCDLIFMNKFRLSLSSGESVQAAEFNAAEVFVDGMDTLLGELGARVSGLKLTRGIVVGGQETAFVLWERSLVFQTTRSVLCDSAERNGRKLTFKVGSNSCNVLLDSEIISTFRMESNSTPVLETCAAAEALRQLRKCCYTIKAKYSKENFGLHISSDDLSSEKSVDYICQKIMSFHCEDHCYCSVTKKSTCSGVRSNIMTGGYLLNDRIFKILDVYHRAKCCKHLVFLSGFSSLEKSIISKTAKSMQLVCWTSENPSGFYSYVEKKVDVRSLLNCLFNHEKTENFDLIPPG